jgi:hypothetical protein
MKIPRDNIIIILSVLSLLFIPVAGVTTGNTTGVHPTGTIQTSFYTPVPTPVPTFLPPVNVSQNVGILPIWLIIGIVLIIIALSGLLWRYFHPKYVAAEEDD